MQYNRGVKVLENGHWTAYTMENSGLESNIINQLLADNQGRIWVATSKGGVSVFNGAGWTTYTAENSGLPNNYVKRISIDALDRVWVPWSGGVSVLEDETWTTHTTENSGLAGKIFSAITFDAQSNAWIATRDEGLSVFDGEVWTAYTAENSGLLTNQVRSLAFDPQNRAWIVTTEGVNVFDGDAWQAFTKEELTGNFLHGEGGLNVLDGQSGRIVWQEDGYDVDGILFDSQGRAWLVLGAPCREEQFRVYANGDWLNYTAENSALPAGCEQTVAVDQAGNFWIVGETEEKGITVLNPAAIQPLSDVEVVGLRFLTSGGHFFLPILLIGLWLGVLLHALPGVGAGLAVGLGVFFCGWVARSRAVFILADVAMVVGSSGACWAAACLAGGRLPRRNPPPAHRRSQPPPGNCRLPKHQRWLVFWEAAAARWAAWLSRLRRLS